MYVFYEARCTHEAGVAHEADFVGDFIELQQIFLQKIMKSGMTCFPLRQYT